MVDDGEEVPSTRRGRSEPTRCRLPAIDGLGTNKQKQALGKEEDENREQRDCAARSAAGRQTEDLERSSIVQRVVG